MLQYVIYSARNISTHVFCSGLFVKLLFNFAKVNFILNYIKLMVRMKRSVGRGVIDP